MAEKKADSKESATHEWGRLVEIKERFAKVAVEIAGLNDWAKNADEDDLAEVNRMIGHWRSEWGTIQNPLRPGGRLPRKKNEKINQWIAGAVREFEGAQTAVAVARSLGLCAQQIEDTVKLYSPTSDDLINSWLLKIARLSESNIDDWASVLVIWARLTAPMLFDQVESESDIADNIRKRLRNFTKNWQTP